MHGIFEPVIKEVISLVLSQIKATKREVKAVLLVGGFGSSAYLRERLRETLRNSETYSGITVRQPTHG